MSLDNAGSWLSEHWGDRAALLAFDSRRRRRGFHAGAQFGEARLAVATRELWREIVTADLTDNDAIERVNAEISPRGRLDALVLSSGIYGRSGDPAVFAPQIAANLVGP